MVEELLWRTHNQLDVEHVAHGDAMGTPGDTSPSTSNLFYSIPSYTFPEFTPEISNSTIDIIGRSLFSGALIRSTLGPGCSRALKFTLI